MFKKLFGLVAALLFSVAAHAAFPASQGYQYRFAAGGFHATEAAAVAEYLDPRPHFAFIGCGSYVSNAATCEVRNTDTGVISTQQMFRQASGLVCPVNATLAGSNCTCNSGYAESGNSCVPTSPACPIGEGRTFNRTEGWGRSTDANADDLVANYGPPSSAYGYNDGVCVGDIARVDRCYRSQEPSSQGLYRVSCDYTMIISSASTTPGDEHADPQNDNAVCPGVVGTVNGKPLCVGTASNPLPSSTAPPNKPTSAGNPAAGAKPDTGEGSGSTGAGRTPSGGSGGNDGGPASAANGRGGSGQRGEPGQDGTAVCGAAPLPPCAVKVDETGVPAEGTAAGRFGQANSDVDGTKNDAEGFLAGIDDITLPGWTWTFSFPTGCTPLVLPAFDDFELDVCQFQPIIHDLMSVLWVIAGIWGLIHLFMRTTGV